MEKNIVLIGMPGCGKSTIGKVLAKELGMKFCDVDKYIEKKENKNIKEIFKGGEGNFRYIESLRVEEVSKYNDTVIATGGGVIKKEINIRRLKENGTVIFINRPLENILKDINIYNRPLLKDKQESLHKLYKERIDLYKKYCDYEILNDNDILNIIDKIKSKYKI